VPTLSTTAIINTAVAGVDSTAASGSQRWNGHSGALTAKREHEAEEQRVEHCGVDAELTVRHRGDDGPEVERARVERGTVGGRKRTVRSRPASMISPPKQVVQQELHRRLAAVLAAEATDQEVQRDQHGFEETRRNSSTSSATSEISTMPSTASVSAR